MLTGHIVVIRDHGEEIYDIPLGGYIVIGRSSSADVQVADLSISKLHCKITHHENQFLLEDLNSRNFTYLNGDKIEKIMSLNSNDLITAGRIDINFISYSDEERLKESDTEVIFQFDNDAKEVSDTSSSPEEFVEVFPPIEAKQQLPELKQQLFELKQEIPESKQEIFELKQEIPEPKQEIFELKQERAEPKQEISKPKPSPVVSTTSLLQAANSPEDAMLMSVIFSEDRTLVSTEKMIECLKIQKKNPKYTLAQILIKMGSISSVDMVNILRTVSDILKVQQGKPQANKVSEPKQELKLEEAKETFLNRDEEKRLQKLFLKVIKTRGLVSQDQLKKCILLHQKYTVNGASIKFLDILIREKLLTKEQVHEIWNFVKGNTNYTIDGYQMVSLIGVGGMGYIYKARQISMDRLVAIKILSEEYSNNPKLNELFLKEARAVAKLNNENIIAGYDFGRRHGFCFFIMEYVDGISLYEKLKNSGDKLPILEALDIIIQVAKALEHASARGFVHRDIKPENVLIKKDGLTKLCDLGLAERVDNFNSRKKEQEFGTPAFMSPEQIRGESNIDIRSDIYSLGITFFRTLFGKLPFQGETREIMAKHLTEKIKFPFEPGSYRERKAIEIIGKMVTKEPAGRYQNPTELLVDLNLAKNPETIELKEPSRSIEATIAIPKLSRRKKLSIRRRRRGR